MLLFVENVPPKKRERNLVLICLLRKIEDIDKLVRVLS
jgi:hypothetical protein